MTDSPVTLELQHSIAFCTLANPPKNEMDFRFFREFERMCRDVFPTLAVTGMIVRGRGRHFSSGADLEELRSQYRQGKAPSPPAILSANIASFTSISELPYPVVAAINGCCLGAGLELALACHYRVAANRAVFALPETTFGLMPGCGGTVRLTTLLGRSKAIEMILTGAMIPSEEALACGLVDACVEKDRLIGAAEAIITRAGKPIPGDRKEFHA
jgi:enoyl-CoA hydratase/carnithine racemase